MKDMMVSLAFMAVYMPFVMGWMMVSDEMLEKFADKIYDFFFAPVAKPEPKVHGDLVAMFGEAADA